MKSIYDASGNHQEDVDRKIVLALDRIAAAFRVLLWQEYSKHGLSPLQTQILIYALTHPHDEIAVTTLSRELGVTPATMSDAVASLEKRNLIHRAKPEGDRRRTVVHLTEAGRLVALDSALYANDMATALAPIDDVSKGRTLETLLRVVHHLQRQHTLPPQKSCMSCRYFVESDNPDTPHFCALLDTPLNGGNLRIDCPEHKPVRISASSEVPAG